jgi:DNA modification methylase
MNQIICGDALEVLKTMQDETVDLVVTSPPYNFDMGYDNHNDNTDTTRYMTFLMKILNECIRVTKKGGRIIINIQPNYKQHFPTHHAITTELIKRGLLWRGEVVWQKNNLKKLTAWGSWMSPSCPYLSYPFEFIEVFSKGTLKHTGEKKNIDITKEEFVTYVNGMWSMAPEKRMKQFNHPAMYPEELVYRCLKLFSYKGDLILDPFNGAGTTTYVAHMLERNYIGIDISPAYCEVAKNRIASHNKLPLE